MAIPSRIVTWTCSVDPNEQESVLRGDKVKDDFGCNEVFCLQNKLRRLLTWRQQKFWTQSLDDLELLEKQALHFLLKPKSK